MWAFTFFQMTYIQIDSINVRDGIFSLLPSRQFIDPSQSETQYLSDVLTFITLIRDRTALWSTRMWDFIRNSPGRAQTDVINKQEQKLIIKICLMLVFDTEHILLWVSNSSGDRNVCMLIDSQRCQRPRGIAGQELEGITEMKDKQTTDSTAWNARGLWNLVFSSNQENVSCKLPMLASGISTAGQSWDHPWLLCVSARFYWKSATNGFSLWNIFTVTKMEVCKSLTYKLPIWEARGKESNEWFK